MPTKLELLAHYINERIGQIICPFYYVSWDYKKLEWKHESKSFRRMWPYYILLIVVVVNALLFLASIPLIYSRSSDLEKSSPFKTIIVAGILVLVTLLLIFVDYLFTVCGCELVYVTNWLYRHEGIRKHKKNVPLANKLRSRELLNILSITIKDFRDPDLVGIAFNCITIGYSFMGLTIAVFYIFGKFDPIYLFIDGLNLRAIKESYWFFSFRLLSYLIGCQWMGHSARTVILLCVGMCVSFTRLLLNLKRASVQSPRNLETLISLYRELSMLLSVLTCKSNRILGSVLSLGYLLIVTGIFCVIFGFKQHDPKMIFVFLFLTIGVFCSVLFIFKIGDFLYSSSWFILNRWRKKCSRWRDFKGKVLLREIDSCRLLIVKAGAISVITVKLQQGFLNALLQDSATALLLWQDKFSVF